MEHEQGHTSIVYDDFSSAESSTFFSTISSSASSSATASSTSEPFESEPIQETIKISIYTPLIYVGILLTSFVVFSIIYRRRKVSKLSQMESFFDENIPKEIYLQLKEQTEPKVHDKVIKAALLRRGVEAIRRSLKLRENETVFKNLYQKGLIGDDLFENYQISLKLQELEIKEIAMEAESIHKGWSQKFFPVAQEICFNEALRRRFSAIDSRSSDLIELWGYHVEKSLS